MKKLLFGLVLLFFSISTQAQSLLGYNSEYVKYHHQSELYMNPSSVDTINNCLVYTYELALGDMYFVFNQKNVCFLQIFYPKNHISELETIQKFNELFQSKKDGYWKFKDREYHCLVDQHFLEGYFIYLIYSKEIEVDEEWKWIIKK